MENNIEIRPLLNIPNVIHVGDGNQLQYGFDYLWDNESVYVIDAAKLAHNAGVIGRDGVDETIMDEWIKSITSNKIEEFIEDRDLSPVSISKRVINNFYGKFSRTNIIGTQIHDAMGRPYIPGSSIKGAMRTAVVATQARNHYVNLDRGTANTLEMMFASGTTDRKESVRSDFFRFVRATDAFYNPGCEAVITVPRMTFDKMNDIKTILEVIAPEEDETASFLLNIDAEKYMAVKESRVMKSMGSMPEEMRSIDGLFHVVNEHTLHLINEEIKTWSLLKTVNAKKYTEVLRILKQECEQCNDGECILRLGMGSGKIFITGAWAMSLPGVKTPKTRAVYREGTDDINVLGFVKLAKVR